jgi:hypothetical protein
MQPTGQPPPEALALATAMDDFNAALQNIQITQAAVQEAAPDEVDAALTLQWQACDLLDAAADALAKAIRAGSDVTRREIRTARMAGVVRTTLQVVES